MRNLQKYEKLFSRDFSLPSVEAWVRGESTNLKGWTKEKQPFLPYIITERSDDTVHFHYNLQGVEWITDLLSKLAHKDNNFLKKTEKTVLSKLTYLRPIYEKEKELNLSSLKKFIRELEEGYPWFEAMWWFCQMDESKLVGLDLRNMQKVRTLTDKLCNGSDTVIRKSLVKIYPHLDDLSSVLSSEEIISGKIPSENELNKRYAGYFFTNKQLFTDLTKSQIAKILKVSFIQEKTKKAKQLKGNIAQMGKASGYDYT